MKLIKLFEQFISEEVELYKAGNAYFSYLDKDFKVLGSAVASCTIKSVYFKPVEGLNITISGFTFAADYYSPESPMRPQPGVFDLKNMLATDFTGMDPTQPGSVQVYPAGTRYIKIYKKDEVPTGLTNPTTGLQFK